METPVLSSVSATDPHLDSFTLKEGETLQRFLLTSPEHAMKRLLAAGSGPIFEISKAFRQGEYGRRHNPEFTLLEWYRPDWRLQELQTEVVDLLHWLGFTVQPEMLTYRDAFLATLGLDPFIAAEEELLSAAVNCSGLNGTDMDRDIALDVLMTHLVEPALPDAVFVCDYPPSQAALARVKDDSNGQRVAMRFELYLHGMEIANAYDELTCANEQYKRFVADNDYRKRVGKPQVPVDHRLLAALEQMPAGAGIALGLDRLFMVSEGYSDIRQVLAFSYSAC